MCHLNIGLGCLHQMVRWRPQEGLVDNWYRQARGRIGKFSHDEVSVRMTPDVPNYRIDEEDEGLCVERRCYLVFFKQRTVVKDIAGFYIDEAL